MRKNQELVIDTERKEYERGFRAGHKVGWRKGREFDKPKSKKEIETMDTLEERVVKFITLSLPGQPQSMHMGTSSLVNDLWREVQDLRKKLDEAKKFPQHCEHGYNGLCPVCDAMNLVPRKERET